MEDDIPICSIDSAKAASIFNHLSHIGVYADMNKFMSFTSLQYVYFIQDLVCNKIIEKYINNTKYNQVIRIYKNNYYTKSTKRKKIKNYILEIISDLTETNDDLLYTRALLIAEQINYDYNLESNQDNNYSNASSNNSSLQPPKPPPLPKSINLNSSYKNLMESLNKKIDSLMNNIEDITFDSKYQDSLSDNDSVENSLSDNHSISDDNNDENSSFE